MGSGQYLVNIWVWLFHLHFESETLHSRAQEVQAEQTSRFHKEMLKSCARNRRINDLWLQCLEILICSIPHFIFKSSRAAPMEQDSGAGENGGVSNK